MIRLAAAAFLVSLTTATQPAKGQRPQPPPPKDTNWVDTITVGRLPTGGCEWSKVRLRPGKGGTLTRAGVPSETTCRVLVYNFTTGSEQERPTVVPLSFVQDRKAGPLPKGAVFNFADTFTVARQPDGNCAWGTTPMRPGPKGSASFLAEVLVKDCWGVVYNVTLPPPPATGITADTFTVIPTDNGPAVVSGDEVVATVRRLYPRPDTARVTNTRIKGDSAWVTVHDRPGGATFFTLVRVQGRWSVTQRASR